MATLNLMAPPGPGGEAPSIPNGVLDLTQTNCEMVQCGAISEQEANLAIATPPGLPSMPFASACTAAGYGGPTGGRFCSDPICQPMKQQIYAAGVSGQGIECCVGDGGTYNPDGTCTMPSATKSVMPSITATAQVVNPTPPTVTPQYLTQKMPSIVNPAPQVAPPVCSDPFAQWVSDNALLVAAGLAGLAYLMLGTERQGRLR